MLRIVEWLIDDDLCAIHKAMKAISSLLPIIGMDNALVAVVNGGGNQINVAVKKIHAPTLNCQQRAQASVHAALYAPLLILSSVYL
jgi:ribosomal protein L1